MNYFIVTRTTKYTKLFIKSENDKNETAYLFRNVQCLQMTNTNSRTSNGPVEELTFYRTDL